MQKAEGPPEEDEEDGDRMLPGAWWQPHGLAFSSRSLLTHLGHTSSEAQAINSSIQGGFNADSITAGQFWSI